MASDGSDPIHLSKWRNGLLVLGVGGSKDVKLK